MIKIHYKALIGIFILLLSTLRSSILLLTGIAPSSTFYFSCTILIIGLIICFSSPISFLKSKKEFSLIKNIFLITLLSGLFWLLIEILFKGSSIGSFRNFIILFISPLSVLLFIHISYSTLKSIIYIIVSIVALSCIYEFWITNVFPAGIIGEEMKTLWIQKITPPETNISISRMSLLIRSHGITGHYHDSGNILAIATVFIAGNLFYKKNKKVLEFLFLFFVFIALITTLSIANIVACIVGIILLNFKQKKGLFSRLFLIILCGSIIFIFFQSQFDLFNIIAPQFDPEGNKMQSMMSVGDSNIFENIITMLIGHEDATGISNLGYFTEASIVVLLMHLGILTFVPLLSLLCFPFYLYYKSSDETRILIWVPVVTVFVAILSLWHYGSLFRSTSVFLFYAFYSLVIKEYFLYQLKSKNNTIRYS